MLHCARILNHHCRNRKWLGVFLPRKGTTRSGRGLVVRMSSIGGAENGACFAYPQHAAGLAPRPADAPPEDARPGNLIQYQEFVKSIREWPFDLSIASRSQLLIVLGAGS
jgi:hypothetical protein